MVGGLVLFAANGAAVIELWHIRCHGAFGNKSEPYGNQNSNFFARFMSGNKDIITTCTAVSVALTSYREP